MSDTDKLQGRHDEFVAKCFEDLEIARAFFSHYLPPTILEQLELERIELEQGSYVDEEFRRSYSDLTYKVPLREKPSADGPLRAYIYILVEHKSESDEFAIFQLLRYMVRIWQRELERANHRVAFRLPPIIPLILHHGRSTFRSPVQFRELVAAIPGVDAFVPNYRCLLVDLMAVAPEELPDSDERLHAVLSVMRSVFGSEIDLTLHDLVTRLAAVANRPAVRSVIEVILNYALRSASQMTDEGFLAAIEPLGETGGDMMSTLIQKWMREGLEQGRAQGRIEDRQDSIMDILATRFGSVPNPVRDAIRGISDSDRLVHLTSTAVTCESLAQFAENLK